MKSNCIQILFVACLIFISALLTSHSFAGVIFKADDRVVIFGDSITERQMYTKYLQLYIDSRYPELHVRFFNAGKGGDTAEGARKRLDRDVLSLHPTVVTLMFGMNDGRYQSLNEALVTNYRTNLEELITTLLAKKLRVIVFTPSCVDPAPGRNLQLSDVNYNATLEALANTALELAAKYHCVSADMFHPMLAYMKAHKAVDPAYVIAPDAIHPNMDGHLVMTYAMLQAIGAEAMPALGDFDMATQVGHNLRMLNNDNHQIMLETTTPTLMPFWFEPATTPVMHDSGLLAMTAQMLTVQNLPAAAYDITIDKNAAGRYTAKQLAAGVQIPGSYSHRGMMAQVMVARKETNFRFNMVDLREGFSDVPEIDAIVNSLMPVDDAFSVGIQQLSKPAISKITLTPAP